jgi:hypothetical protein
MRALVCDDGTAILVSQSSFSQAMVLTIVCADGLT